MKSLEWLAVLFVGTLQAASALAGDPPWGYSDQTVPAKQEIYNAWGDAPTADGSRKVACVNQCNREVPSRCGKAKEAAYEAGSGNSMIRCQCTYSCVDWNKTKDNIVAAARDAATKGQQPDCSWLNKNDIGSHWARQCDQAYDAWKATQDAKKKSAEIVDAAKKKLDEEIDKADKPKAVIEDMHEVPAADTAKPDASANANVIVTRKLKATIDWGSCQYLDKVHNRRTCWSVTRCNEQGTDRSFRIDVRCSTENGDCPAVGQCVGEKRLKLRSNRPWHKPAQTEVPVGN
jgi:hypothetical protein